MGFIRYVGTENPHFVTVRAGTRQETIVVSPQQVQQHDDAVCSWLLAHDTGSWVTATGLDSPSSTTTTSADSQLREWVLTEAYSLVSITRDSNEVVSSARVVWPDGSTGVYTTDTASSLFPGEIDAFHVTYVTTTGPTRTVTQSSVTRDASGSVIAQPALTVS